LNIFPDSSDDGLYGKLFFLFAGTLLFDEKIRQSADKAVFRNVRETPTVIYKHNMYDFRIFLDRFCRGGHTNRLPKNLHSAVSNFELGLKVEIKIKN
jgi:hypothetical protein